MGSLFKSVNPRIEGAYLLILGQEQKHFLLLAPFNSIKNKKSSLRNKKTEKNSHGHVQQISLNILLDKFLNNLVYYHV